MYGNILNNAHQRANIMWTILAILARCTYSGYSTRGAFDSPMQVTKIPDMYTIEAGKIKWFVSLMLDLEVDRWTLSVDDP